MSKKLTSFPENSDGFKNDGRGTWTDDGEYSTRHSVDSNPGGSISEHNVVTSKSSGETWVHSNTYTPSPNGGYRDNPSVGGSSSGVCPKCGKRH